MRHKGPLCFAIAVFLSTAIVTPQTHIVAITGVSIVDVVDGHIVPDSTIVISGDKITRVERNGAPPAGSQLVDGGSMFLIPGLWDMHAHMEANGASALQLYVANGVTGIRDMGSDLDLILAMRDATASGHTLGPRIFAAGPILDDAPGDWPYRMRVRSAADGTAAVRLLKRRGVDLIKVHDHTPREAFLAIASEARRQHLPLAGHVPIGISFEEAIDAGQGDFEHLSNLQLWKSCSGGDHYSAQACRPFFDMLAHRGIWQTPTLLAMSELMTIGTPSSNVSAEQLQYASQSLRRMWAGNQGAFATPELVRMFRDGAAVGAVVTRDMWTAGVGVLAGCDGMVPGFCVHDELLAMVRGGMTPLAALQTATLNPRRYFNLPLMSGGVVAGERADLVLLAANPVSDINNTRRIRAVIAGGRVLDRKNLDNLLTDVKTAAAKR
jgi:predicted amidohydrolase YtcJ